MSPKETLDEYGIVTLVEKYVVDQEAEELIGNYISNLINKLAIANDQNKEMRDFIEGNEYDITPEFKKKFPNGLE